MRLQTAPTGLGNAVTNREEIGETPYQKPLSKTLPGWGVRLQTVKKHPIKNPTGLGNVSNYRNIYLNFMKPRQ